MGNSAGGPRRRIAVVDRHLAAVHAQDVANEIEAETGAASIVMALEERLEYPARGWRFSINSHRASAPTLRSQSADGHVNPRINKRAETGLAGPANDI